MHSTPKIRKELDYTMAKPTYGAYGLTNAPFGLINDIAMLLLAL
jgi:hypothetical protein